MITIDHIDHLILSQLQSDASQPLEELGQLVGLSRNACWRRIKSLEDNGVIKGKVAVVDPEKVGLGLQVFIQIKTAKHTAEWSRNFAKIAANFPEIQGAYRMTGDLDYLIRARVSDIASYDTLYQKLTEKIEMADVSASFVMEEIKETTQLPV